MRSRIRTRRLVLPLACLSGCVIAGGGFSKAVGAEVGTSELRSESMHLSLKSQVGGGVKVEEADPSINDQLRTGDVISSVSGRATDTPEAFFAALRAVHGSESIAMSVLPVGDAARTVRLIHVSRMAGYVPPEPPHPPPLD